MAGNTQISFIIPTPWSISPSWRGDSAHLIKNSTAFYGTPIYTFWFCVWDYVRISAVTPSILTAICSPSVSSNSVVQKLSSESVRVRYCFPSYLDSVVRDLSSVQSAPYHLSYIQFKLSRDPHLPLLTNPVGFSPKKNSVCIFSATYPAYLSFLGLIILILPKEVVKFWCFSLCTFV